MSLLYLAKLVEKTVFSIKFRFRSFFAFRVSFYFFIFFSVFSFLGDRLAFGWSIYSVSFSFYKTILKLIWAFLNPPLPIHTKSELSPIAFLIFIVIGMKSRTNSTAFLIHALIGLSRNNGKTHNYPKKHSLFCIFLKENQINKSYI